MRTGFTRGASRALIRWQLCTLCPLTLIGSTTFASGPGGVKLDGTLGPTAAVLAGPTYGIGQNMGKLSGGNVFFSFQYFNIGTGETALFTTTSAGINNVISRVTGGTASTIDGTIELQAAYGSPNFFLINPAGVTFTSNAVIDVPAAFYVSTANYLKFPDGNFYVGPSKMSTLSAAAPEAFGFTGATRAAVNLVGANLTGGNSGAGDFQIAAGDVTIDGEASATGVGIQNTTGGIRVTAVGSASGEVPMTGAYAATDGAVSITDGGSISTQGQGSTTGGAIEIYAGSITVDGANPSGGGLQVTPSGISTSTDQLGLGTNSAGPITVTVAGNVSLLNGGQLFTISDGSGRAGNISLTAGSLTIDSGFNLTATGIISVPTASGPGGAIVVNVTGATSLQNFGEIYANNAGSGTGGSIQLNTGSLTMDGGPHSFAGGIFDGAYLSQYGVAQGTGGDITINVAGAASISNGMEVGDGTLGAGHAGNISFNAESLTISQTVPYFYFFNIPFGLQNLPETGILADTYGSGNGGRIDVKVGSLKITGGSQGDLVGISSSDQNVAFSDIGGTAGSGAAGAVTISVTGDAIIQNGGQVASATYGAGPAGSVSLTAAGLTLGGGSNPSAISTQAAAGSGGHPGQVTINTAALVLDAGGSIDVANNATVSSPSPVSPSQITINAQSIAMNGGEITAASSGNVAASSIDITYTAFLRMSPSVISTSAVDGNGGAITITGQGPLIIDHSNITTSVSGTSNGNGGDVSIRAPEIILNTGAIQANTSAPLASGGTVTIDAAALVPSYESLTLGGSAISFDSNASGLNVVQAAAADGVNGVLAVTVPTLDLGNALLGLTGRPAAATALGRALCTVGRASSLEVAGRGGVATTAYDPLWLDLTQSALGSHSLAPSDDSFNQSTPILVACR